MNVAETAPESELAILNVAAYKFVHLTDLERRQTELRKLCNRLGLRGTILLSPEGINLFLAGETSSVGQLLQHLRHEPEFADLQTKDSYSEKQPFRRMLVRLKKEIIAFGVDEVQPAVRTSPKLSAHELKTWLDEGRSLRLLDVRNIYEVDLGTFRGAEHLHIGHFREFPQAIANLPPESKQQPIVMFCTGGIRCEKAGPLMEQAGFSQVYQLDGGILKYFEECGSEHYEGSCFVFDGRVALAPDLKPTGAVLCFACQAVLTQHDLCSDKFLFGKYCPNCYQPPEQRRLAELQLRRERIRQIAESQPGMAPYDNVRAIHVPGRFAGMKLIDFLDAWHPPTGRDQWTAWLQAGQITDSNPCLPEQIVREGQCFEQHMPNTVEPKINPDIELLFEDQSLVVINKPAPLPCHPSGRFNRNTLSSILAPAYPNEKLRVAHRLDANTSGVVILCRKYQPARFVQPQFSHHQVEKCYVARVLGQPNWDTWVCDEPISDGPISRAGVRGVDAQSGQSATTTFMVLQRLPDNTSLVQAVPLTGRTNQIRVHLWHLGFPVKGDPLYLAGGQLGQTATLSVTDLPMCLHAQRLTFVHPDSKQKVTYESPLPSWASV